MSVADDAPRWWPSLGRWVPVLHRWGPKDRFGWCRCSQCGGEWYPPKGAEKAAWARRDRDWIVLDRSFPCPGRRP